MQDDTTAGWVASAPRDALQLRQIDLPVMGEFDIEIDVSVCGLCHSDLHLVNGDWGIASYPLVPGHEVVGRVCRTGPGVDWLEPGQRVGVGWQAGACLSCRCCNAGDDNLCSEPVRTCVGRPGGFAKKIRVDARFAHFIPEALSDAEAAPLLCAGVTVFSALQRRVASGGFDVGVVGIGGLGHLAIQFAKQMGNRPTAIGRTRRKLGDAMRLGADAFIATGEREAVVAARNTLDFLLVTVSGDLDWHQYLSLLRPNGMLCLAGIPSATVTFPSHSFVTEQKTVTGTSVGSRAMTDACLGFAAANRVSPWLVEKPIADINLAMGELAAGDIRYRAVLRLRDD